jgi:glycosyltransferase involved in cell wall biosynthesis
MSTSEKQPIFDDSILKNRKGVSIIIPAFNEEKGIAAVLKNLKKELETLQDPYEVIVVNDGSIDKTKDVISESKTDIVLINHEFNQGYGASLKTGIRNAKFGLIAITDADGTYPNNQIPAMVALAKEGFDMVVGARIGKNVNIPWIRKPAKWFLGALANYLTGIPIPDLNSGLRIMRREVVERFLKILPNGFSFTTTITLAMLTNGFNVKYMSIDYFSREGVSKIRPISDTLNFIQLILRTILYFEPLKIFLPISFFILLVGTSGFVFSFLFYGIVLDLTFIILGTCAIQLMAIGLLADLFDKRL